MSKPTKRRSAKFHSKLVEAGFSDFSLNILGFQEDGEWVALALEMDLRGHGPTFHDALNDLRDLVGMQISFALFKGLPQMILKPAPAFYFELFALARQRWLSSWTTESAQEDLEYQAGSMAIPPHLLTRHSDRFTLSDG